MKIDDVAREAGVSKATVSNVFTKNRYVSPEVSKRVLSVAERLQFRPSYVARTLTMKKTKTIGLNMSAERMKFSQFHLSLINGVLRTCYERGYRLLINTISATYDGHVEDVTDDPVDGEIILDPASQDRRLRSVLDKNIPVVVVGRPPEDLENKISFVDNDNVAMANEVTSYLMNLNHRKILLLNAEEERTVASDRYKGYRLAFHESGLSPDAEFVCHKSSELTSVDFGFNKLVECIERGRIPTAVITDTDKMALGVYRAAEKLGLNIPKDLSVFAFSDDSVFGPEIKPPLSGVALHPESLGGEAVNMLLERVADNSIRSKKVYVPFEMVLRDSCAVADVWELMEDNS